MWSPGLPVASYRNPDTLLSLSKEMVSKWWVTTYHPVKVVEHATMLIVVCSLTGGERENAAT